VARLSDAPHVLLGPLAFSLRFSEHLCDPLNNGIDLAHHFEVPESKHAMSIDAQELAPAFVLLFLIRVLRTIDFDD